MSNIVIEGKTFKDEDKILNFENKIREVVKIGNTYIVRFAFEEILCNVNAYDLDGNKLWNINDILRLEFEDAYVGIKESEDFENCVEAQSYWGFIYCIDIEKKEVIDKIFIK